MSLVLSPLSLDLLPRWISYFIAINSGGLSRAKNYLWRHAVALCALTILLLALPLAIPPSHITHTPLHSILYPAAPLRKPSEHPLQLLLARLRNLRNLKSPNNKWCLMLDPPMKTTLIQMQRTPLMLRRSRVICDLITPLIFIQSPFKNLAAKWVGLEVAGITSRTSSPCIQSLSRNSR